MQAWVRSKPVNPPAQKAKMPKVSNGTPTPIKLPKTVNSPNVSRSKK